MPLVLCLLAFCATALLVYRLGRDRWRATRSSQPTPQRRTLLNDRIKPRRVPRAACQPVPPAEKARQELRRCVARQETFSRQLAEAGAKPEAVEQRQEPVLPPMIDNPQWLESQRKLAQLQRRREQLLVDRTPLHPAVKEIDGRIADAEEQLAAIPRQIAHKAATIGRADSRTDGRAVEQVAKKNQQTPARSHRGGGKGTPGPR